MDGVTVGGYFISAFLQVFFDRIATWEFAGYFKIKGVNDMQFEKMKTKSLLADLVLADAEQKQFSDPRVKNWLDKHQELIYDIQELVDQINLYVSQNWMGKINLQFKGRSAAQLNEEISGILVKLESIVELKDFLGLVNVVRTIRPHTTSWVEESSVYGRDADKEAIMELLLSHEMSCNKISVIPIVGMGGIGKTTLAQLIYNDRVMQDRFHFDFKVWVCVRNDSDIFKVTKTIAKKVITSRTFDNDDLKSKFTSLTFDDGDDLDFLQVKLKEGLKGKKLLLVLDDILIEKYSFWSELKKLFEHGECESKIIVTTQSQEVASNMMCDLPSYHLKTMLEDDCWKLFEEHAFNNSNPNAHSKLENFGKEIVYKCKGFPLAVKLFGGLLRNQLNSKEWESILDSDIWFSKMRGNVIPNLFLSFHYLPSHLKRCFAYCSIFPKSHQFDKEDLIKLWMAEGLLQPEDMKTIEEVGEERFKDLLSRSLFQQSVSRNKSFTMHDLVNDLASFLVGDFCLRSDCSSCLNKSSNKIRYWSHLEDRNNKLEKLEALFQAKHLRTLLLSSTHYFKSDLQLNEFAKLLPSFTCLRALSLYGSSILKLPDSVGDLKLLRYLNLSKTNIQEIPATVCTLYYLQTLLLQFCTKLKSLPDNMNKLTNLRHLDIKNTSIKEMPTEMGSLKDLQTLSVFYLGKDNAGSAIKELQKFQDLRGSLHILGLENVMNVEEVSATTLNNMKYLTELELKWRFTSGCPKILDAVLSRLQPHTNIKFLTIYSWGGENFPNWVGNHSFGNLEQIQLLGCVNCSSLPPLAQLPFLKHLVIWNFNRLLKIGDEFYYGSSSEAIPFCCLERLEISSMPECQDWSFVGGDFKHSFPQLKELVLKACPKLTGELCLPETMETIEVKGCHKLDLKFSENHRYNSLKKLHISGSCSSMKCLCLDRFTKLNELHLECENLEFLVNPDQSCPALPFLRCLKLTKCPKFETFPQGGLHATNLEEFHITSCNNLRSLPEQMPSLLSSLQILEIYECPKMESFSEQGLPSKLKKLSICCCESLFKSRSMWNLQGLISLSELSISYIKEELDSFPEEGLLPSTLNVLRIEKFSKLKALNSNAFRGLPSLETLSVSDCRILQSLPNDKRLLDSLKMLDISGSKKLEERYQRAKEDWHKVSRIPFLIMNQPL